MEFVLSGMAAAFATRGGSRREGNCAFSIVAGATLGDECRISTETTPWSCIWWKNLRIKRLFQIGCLFDTPKNRVVTSSASLAPEG